MAKGEEQRDTVRVEAFSDGVVAIIVTIMVLELKVPGSDDPRALLAIWPTFLAYALSFAYVAVYWVNHHRLLTYATHTGNGFIWANMLLLFSLSLVPFATAYLGEHELGQFPVILYLAVLLGPSVSYIWLQQVIRRDGRQDEAAHRYHRASIRKGLAANLLYVVGIAATFLHPAAGLATAVLVALLWFLPDGPFDRLFGRSA